MGEDDFDLEDLDEEIEDSKNTKHQDNGDFSDYDEDYDEEDMFDEDFSDFGGGGGVAPMEKHNDLLKQLTDFAPYLKDKMIGWLGLVWDQEQEKYVVDENVKPIMNKQCAKWCVEYLRTYARKNNIITHIGKEDYLQIQEDIIDVVWLNLGTRMEEFGLSNNGDLLTIAVELHHAAILVLMGAGDGKYGNLLKETVNRNETVSYSDRNSIQPQQVRESTDGFISRIGKALKGGR